jgi:hypothetical protein
VFSCSLSLYLSLLPSTVKYALSKIRKHILKFFLPFVGNAFFQRYIRLCMGTKAAEAKWDFYSKEPSTEEKMLFLLSADA